MIWLWVGFIAIIFILLALDLGVLNRRPHVIRAREALLWSLLWISIALAFNFAIYYIYEHHWFGIGIHIGHQLDGKQAALQFFTGYIIEKSLSVDNIFIIALIFSYFGVELRYQHRVLFWGIIGALVMRGIMIGAGVALIQRFEWMTYVFGLMLLLTAIKMLVSNHEKIEPERNPLIRLARRFFPVTKKFHQEHFTYRVNKRVFLTPLFLVLLVIESTDVVFAIDSIPAIFAVTTDPFIIFTSNIFAILGLRSLYFALAAVMNRFRYLKHSLVIVLGYVGMKMLLEPTFHIPTLISLGIIATILTIGTIISLIATRQEKNQKKQDQASPPPHIPKKNGIHKPQEKPNDAAISAHHDA